MSEIYCGIYDVPHGKRRGTMNECLACGQVRYYGLKKLNKSLIPSRDEKKKTEDELLQLKLAGELGTLRGKINDLLWKFRQQPNPDKKALLKQQGLILEEEAKKVQHEFDKVTKQINKLRAK